MVIIFRVVVLMTFLVLGFSAHSFKILRGPSFLNGGDEKIDVFAVVDGRAVPVKEAVPARQLFATVNEIQPQLIVVVSGAHRYELSEAEYLAQSGGIAQKWQFWIFDGSRICVKDSRHVDKISFESRNIAC